MTNYIKNIFYTLTLSLFIIGCGSTNPNGSTLPIPEENIDKIPLKFSELTENEKQNWNHLDLVADTIPGMSVDKAYNEIIKNKKGKTIVVAVIDAGIDINHEDLDGVIWKNTDEIANNGKDDDKNGYIDDVNGWNFLGEGYFEQMEYTRIVAAGNTNDPLYQRAKKELEENRQKYSNYKTQYEQLLTEIKTADKAVAQHLGKEDYTLEDVNNIKTQNESLARSVSVIKYVYSLDFESVDKGISELEEQLADLNKWMDYRLNTEFKGRKTGDDLTDIEDAYYGNNNVRPRDKTETHGTNVAGIIAAERNNNKGVKGVANNVKIMPLRVVSDADEYDKDVALAIRYAVDNGANIINASFGKYYSPNVDWVKDAIKYAAQKDVLIVHAAGNDGSDIDAKTNFPNDELTANEEIADNFISVGAINPKYGSSLVANYSNFGKKNVDIYAPGTDVYSTDPNNNYEYVDGTSFAAPNVSGLAALIWSQNPKLKSHQVKSIIINSGLELTNKVAIGGNPKDVRPFADLSRSGRIANAYNALVMANSMN